MPDTSALEPGILVAGRYRITRKIGHGGMGAVYEVSHVHTDERLALKVLHPQVLRDAEAVERFRREARAPARITSEHVARVTDADTAADLDGAPFYVMELLVGRDLERIVGEDGPIPPSLVVELLAQTARALDKAHALGIVHRDLKPENLFLTQREDGSPCIKLLDFGIARLAATEAEPLKTQGGRVFGTPNYMAPEQAVGSTEEIGPRADIWAIGLVAFKLLVGFEFFTGTTTPQLYAQILAEPIATPTARGAAFGAPFDAWFARCVARSIADRFPSASDAIRELAGALGVPLPERARLSSVDLSSIPRLSQTEASRIVAPQTAGPRTMAEAGVPAPPRRMAILAGGALLTLLGIVTIVLAFRRGSASEAHGLVATQASAEAADASATNLTLAPASAVPSASAPATASVVAHAQESGKGRRSGTSTAPAAEGSAKLDRATKKRLDALEHLCAQGTFSAAECQAKRQAIIRGGT